MKAIRLAFEGQRAFVDRARNLFPYELTFSQHQFISSSMVDITDLDFWITRRKRNKESVLFRIEFGDDQISCVAIKSKERESTFCKQSIERVLGIKIKHGEIYHVYLTPIRNKR